MFFLGSYVFKLLSIIFPILGAKNPEKPHFKRSLRFKGKIKKPWVEVWNTHSTQGFIYHFLFLIFVFSSSFSNTLRGKLTLPFSMGF